MSRAAGIPPARCVWFSKLWAHASRRWSLPELLSACKAVEGAELAELVRLAGVNGAPTTALGLFREARALGWCDADGGAAVAAMAWIHDGAGQAKAADALWAELHERARRGDVDVAALRRAAGVKPWGVKKRSRDARANAARDSSSRDETDASHLSSSAPPRRVSVISPSPTDISRARFETFAVEVASKARRRSRAAVTAYARMRDGDPAANWRGRDEAGAPSRYPRRVFTAACRAASRVGDVSFASRVAVDMATDGVKPDTYAVACLVPILGRTGRAVDADAAEAIFLRAREEGRGPRTPNALGGVAWSCAVGAACRAGRLDRAADLLAEMGEEPFMREWPSCPVPEGERNEGEGEGEGEGGASSTSTSTSTSNASSSSSRVARRAAAERRAAAPAYAQVMHALCDAGRHAEALGIHESMRAAGISGLSNPPHYRALFKATAGAGGKGGGPLPPRKAAARTVADAVLAAVAVSRGEAPFLPYEEEDEEEDDADDERDDERDGERDVGRVRVRVRRSDRESVASPSRAMATATALGDATLSATAIRATLQVAAAGGFPDVASEARARMRWTRVPSAPEDLELTLEAYARAGDARGAVAHWNANRRALTAESEAAEGEASMVWEVGSDGVLVSGANPRRARGPR